MPTERMVHVVDDDPAVRRSLERLLNSAGCTTTSYESPLSFLDAAPGLSSGCVLLDVRMMTLMDGLQVQARLYEIGSTFPIIMMTGQADVQTAVRAMKAGASDFIEKPFDDVVLLDAIEGLGPMADAPIGLANPPTQPGGSEPSVAENRRCWTA
jgi:two-component system response regulator FixJ